MRRSEITPELIELSKRAKELGFPQDIVYADWYIREDKHYKSGYSNPLLWVWQGQEPKPELKEAIFLILSFFRCLEWLRRKGYGAKFEFIPKRSRCEIAIHSSNITIAVDSKATSGHEAIAKAVVKILEGDND
jgi:hypothetical protein